MKPAKAKGASRAAAKARKLSRLFRPGKHWFEWPMPEKPDLEDGFAWRSDVMYNWIPHLDIAESKDGRLFLVDQEHGLNVCEVTGAEAWSYIASRYLPPVLQSR